MCKIRRYLLILCILVMPQLLAGAVYYVATNGSDSYNGLYPSYQSGSNGPFRTLSKAATTVKAGDTVQIRGGTYRATSTWNTDGTEANCITITNHNYETVSIDGNSNTIPSAEGADLLLINGDWYNIRNREISYSGWDGMEVKGDNCAVDNIYVHHSWGGGIIFTGWYGLVNNCRAYNNSLMNKYASMSVSWAFGISACRYPQYTTIRGCTAWDNWGEGISTFETYHITIEDCVSYNNMTNFYISDTQYCLFQRNSAYCTPGNMIQNYARQNNILMGDEKSKPVSSNNTIVNNLSLGGERNIAVGNNANNLLIAHNTFANASNTEGSESACVYFYSTPHTNSRFQNNIMLQENSVDIAHMESSGIAFGYNTWSKTPPSNCQGTGSIIGNPLLAKTGSTGAGQLTPGYFKILASSPAIGMAQVLGGVTEDFFRTTRGSDPDTGAHEFSTGTSSLIASATGSPTSGQAPLAVNFTGSASGGTSPYSYRWTFGDGGSSTSQNPAHTYSSAGSYTATLTVTDSTSTTATRSLTITAAAAPSQLVATASASPTSGQAPLAVNFTGSATGGTSPYSYSWTFGDGGTSTYQNPAHTYSSAGNYTATLTVTDSSSRTASATASVTVGPVITGASLSLTAQTGAPAPGQGGTTDPAPGTYNYSIGSSVQAKSIPYTNYRFSKWDGNISPSGMFSTQTSLIMDNNKSLISTFCTNCADVNGDLKITPADAQAAFDIYLRRISSPTWCELENADVNSSGTKLEPKVPPSDAQMIFNKHLRRGTVDGTCSGDSRAATTSTQNLGLPAVKLAISNSAVYQSGDILIPIIIESPSAIGAFGFH